MNRRLVIVSNSGKDKNLAGINQDVANYVNFFRKPEGGLWDFTEGGDADCFDTNSIDADEYLDYLSCISENETIDFWVLVFAGHGGSDPDKVDVLEICPEQKGVNSDCSFREIRQAIGRKARAVLITDCCRVLISKYQEGGRISESLFSATTLESDEYAENCLNLYNSHFMKVPEGTMFIAQSCSYGESAGGSSRGGLYSYQLLKQAESIIKSQKEHYNKPDYPGTVFSLSYVHALASPMVINLAANKGNEQHPEYSAPRCNQPPFCVIARNPRRMIFG